MFTYFLNPTLHLETTDSAELCAGFLNPTLHLESNDSAEICAGFLNPIFASWIKWFSRIMCRFLESHICILNQLIQQNYVQVSWIPYLHLESTDLNSRIMCISIVLWCVHWLILTCEFLHKTAFVLISSWLEHLLDNTWMMNLLFELNFSCKYCKLVSALFWDCIQK